TAAKIAAGAITADKLAASIILSGTIWAGYNKVKLSSAGIDIYGQVMSFISGSTRMCLMGATSSGMGVVSTRVLALQGNDGVAIKVPYGYITLEASNAVGLISGITQTITKVNY